jgi:hypothetical protein
MAGVGTNEVVTFIGGKMNKSVDERLLPDGEYIDALNIRIGSTELSSMGAIENAIGNVKLTSIAGLSEEAECIGAYQDGANETIYWFIADPLALDMVVSFNVGTQTLNYHVKTVGVLNFDKKYRINGINLIDDLLFWTDNLNPPRKININRAYPFPNPTDQITAEDINVIVAPPMEAPSIQLFNVAGEQNYISDKFLSFSYRYKYLDGEYSALSKFTDIAFEPGAFNIDYSTYTNSGMENLLNTIKVSFNTGDENVIGLDVCFKYSTSSIINVVEKYNKQEQGWANDVTQEILFNNKKIYTVLPESELLRIYDNVPLVSKAQTTMGNRIFYGNYVDGYDIDVDLDYDIEKFSETIGADELNLTEKNGIAYSIDPSFNGFIYGSKLDIDLSNIDLKEGSTLVIDFNFIHKGFTGSSLYPPGAPINIFQEIFYYTFPRDYNSVFDLGTDQSFIDALYTHQPIANCSEGLSFTDIFNCSLVTKQISAGVPAWTKTGSGISSNNGGFEISVSNLSNILGIQVPAMEFSVESPSGTINRAYEYFENVATEAYVTSPGSKKSLHSNRDYELAIVYMDDYGRRSTALTVTNNTAFFPASTSDTRNYLQVSVNNLAPSWAKKYEFVLKPSKAGYETIFCNLFFIDEDGYTWFKLDGDNRSKVKTDQMLVVKSDSSGVLNSLVRTKVLDIEAKGSGFISGGALEPAGTYMRLKASNFQAIYLENSYVAREILSGGGQSFPQAYVPFFQDNPLYVNTLPITPGNQPYMPIPIPAGSLITIRFEFIRNSAGSSCGSRIYNYDRVFVSNNDYDSFYSFIEGQQVSLTNGISSGDDDIVNANVQSGVITDYHAGGTIPIKYNVNQYQFAEGYIDNDTANPKDGRIFLGFRGGTPYCSGKTSMLHGYITIQQSISSFIFETDPEDANGEIFYENDQVFDIVDGLHQGNVSNQTSALNSATSNLDFFNCFSFGNGCESYKIGDSLTGAPFYIGSRVTAVSQEDYMSSHRYASVTYSGVYNQDTNINKLNEYNLALSNYRDLEKVFGSIEILYGRKTDLLVLQEDKISYVLQGKNLLSDAAGGGAITSVPEVLGTQISRIEENGISNNPDTFIVDGAETFFTDVKRSSVLNLRGGSYGSDQLVVISDSGMKHWFRDEFKNSLNNLKIGGYDPYMSEYVLSLKDELLPIDEEVNPCGTVISKYNSSEESTYYLNLGKTIGQVTFNIEVVSGDLDVIVEYDGVIVFDRNVVENIDVIFNKTSFEPELVRITVVPNNATFTISSPCPDLEPLTVVKVVLNSPASQGLTTHANYRWALGTSISPYDINFVTLNSSGVSLYQLASGFTSEGTTPAIGSDIALIPVKETGDTYTFNPSNSFKYLVSNTLYDVPSLVPLLNNATPITNPSTGTYQAIVNDFAYTGQYLYLVWDLRISNEILLCYSSVDEYDACCDCSSTSNYFINSSSFSATTSIYTDSSLTILAVDGWYQSEGTYRQLLDGVLLDPISCPVCADCLRYTATISSGSGSVDWTSCDGDAGFGEVTPGKPIGFCAQVGTVTASDEVIITIGDPCTDPLVGCYTIKFNPDSECSTSISNVLVSYTKCNGIQVIDEVIPVVGSTSVCALVGGIGLQPAFTCGDGTIEYGLECVTPIVECLSYTVWTYTNGGANYLDCEGNPQSVSVGGTSGYDQAVFCAEINSVVTNGDSNLIINGDCI